MKEEMIELILNLSLADEKKSLDIIQQLSSFGDEYLDLFSKQIIENPSLSEPLTKVITYTVPPRDFDKLCRLTKSINPNLVLAAFNGLGLSEKRDALECLYHIYETTWSKELAVISIGKLGFVETESFLIEKTDEVFRRIEPVLKSNKALLNDEEFDESDLSLFMQLLKSLKRIGKQKHLQYLSEMIYYTSNSEYSEQHLLRANAIELIGELLPNNCISVLINALNNDDYEVRENAIWALYILGTPKAMYPLFNFALKKKISSSNRLFWCLKKWSGVDLRSIEEYQLWWKEHERFFKMDACYKLGTLMSIDNMIMNLNNETTELHFQLRELEIYTGLDFHTCLFRNPDLNLIDKAKKLFESKSAHFELGGHYRFGRPESPEFW